MRKYIILALLALFIITPFRQVLAVGTDYRYTGKPLDSSTNLYYYGQRYYNPSVGQFTQPDPVSRHLTDPQKLKQSTGQDLQQFLEDPQKLNDYSYTLNNPVKYTDPTGEQALPAVGAVGGAVWGSPNAYNSGKALLQGNLSEASNQAGKFLTKVGIGLIIGATAELVVRVIPLVSGVLGIVKIGENLEIGKKAAIKIGQGIFAKQGGNINQDLLANLYKESSKIGLDKALSGAQKSLTKFYQRLGDHVNKLEYYSKNGGYVSSIKAEIVNFKNSIETLTKFISDNQ